MRTKRSRADIIQCAIQVGIIGLLVSVAGCGRMNYLDKRIDNTNCQVDTLNRKVDILHEEIKAYSASSRKRSSDQDLALRRVEHTLTSQHETHVEASDTRSAGHDAALRQLDSRVSSQLEALDKASQKRSDSQSADIRQLKDRVLAQERATNLENAKLRSRLGTVQVELAQLIRDSDVRDAQVKRALADLEQTSRKDLLELTRDMRTRYADTHRALAKITQASAENTRGAAEVRTAMQRLIEAHAFFVRDNENLVKTLEAEKGKEGPRDAESVLGILYEQRKAQMRLLHELQALLSQALSANETS